MATKTQKERKASGKVRESQKKLAGVVGGGTPEPALTNPVNQEFKHVSVSDDTIVPLMIKDILSNSQNPRESAPSLTQMGYGIFHKLPGSDKPSIVALALSDKIEDKAEYVKLTVRFEEGVVNLAHNFRAIGMRQPVQVRPIPGGYDLIFGCRRLLSHLFNYCLAALSAAKFSPGDKKISEDMEDASKGDYPATVRALICEADDERAGLISLSENLHRLNMNPMEQARIFARMRQSEFSIPQIADVTNIDHQVVRQRLQLLKLPEDQQAKVEEGELGVVKALKLVKGKDNPTKPGATGKGHKGDGGRRKAPSIKDFQTMYEEREPDAVYTEQVRRYIASEVIAVEYLDFKKLCKEKEKVAEQQKAAAARNGEKDD